MNQAETVYKVGKQYIFAIDLLTFLKAPVTY